jgi:hypothetical protein
VIVSEAKKILNDIILCESFSSGARRYWQPSGVDRDFTSIVEAQVMETHYKISRLPLAMVYSLPVKMS